MSANEPMKFGLLRSVYRIFGRLSSDRPFVPDGPLTTGSIIERWRKRRRYRWHLRRIIDCSPELLDDIGLDEKTANAEVAKPFWVP